MRVSRQLTRLQRPSQIPEFAACRLEAAGWRGLERSGRQGSGLLHWCPRLGGAGVGHPSADIKWRTYAEYLRASPFSFLSSGGTLTAALSLFSYSRAKYPR